MKLKDPREKEAKNDINVLPLTTMATEPIHLDIHVPCQKNQQHYEGEKTFSENITRNKVKLPGQFITDEIGFPMHNSFETALKEGMKKNHADGNMFDFS